MTTLTSTGQTLIGMSAFIDAVSRINRITTTTWTLTCARPTVAWINRLTGTTWTFGRTLTRALTRASTPDYALAGTTSPLRGRTAWTRRNAEIGIAVASTWMTIARINRTTTLTTTRTLTIPGIDAARTLTATRQVLIGILTFAALDPIPGIDRTTTTWIALIKMLNPLDISIPTLRLSHIPLLYSGHYRPFITLLEWVHE
jgi:hypothetical protein